MGQFHQNLIEVMLENRLNSQLYQSFHISKVILFAMVFGGIVHKSQKLNVSKTNLCPAIYYFYKKMITTGTKIRLLQSILLLVRS